METKKENTKEIVEKNLEKWCNLQKLIKEEITLNDIIIKHQENTNEEMKKLLFEIFKNKIKIKETIEFNQKISRQDKIPNLNYQLCENPEKLLSECLNPIEKFLFKFRNDFQLQLKLIDLIEKNENKTDADLENLVDFFCHYYYENLLIQNPEHDELLIFCFLLLEKEIENMNSPSVSSFLDCSFNGSLFKSYAKRSDLKLYFSMILNELILNVDNNTDTFLEIDISRISDHIKKQEKNKIVDKRFVTEKSKNLFTVDNDHLTKLIKKSSISYKKQNTIINTRDSESNEELTYSIQGGMVNTGYKPQTQVDFSDTDSENINISEIKDFDDESNMDYSIYLDQDELTNRMINEKDPDMKEFYLRQLSKMGNDYDIYTNKKFISDLSQLHEKDQILVIYRKNFEKMKDFIDNLYKSLIANINSIPYSLRSISEFFFFKCIVPILTNPEYYAIVSSTVISIDTRKNFFNIAKVLKKINRALFFDSKMETMFTIFNHYIIEIMPAINEFYTKLIDVPLPQLIEDLLNKKSKDFTTYNYFVGNDEELINIQPICFNIQDVLYISKLVKQNSIAFEDNLIKKSAEKIIGQEQFLTNNFIKNQEKKMFFMIYRQMTNPNKQDILGLEDRIIYTIKLILKGIGIINSKNYSQFEQASNTNKFFNSLNNIVQMETESEHNNIPLNWYSLYLIANIQFISDEQKANDFHQLYQEIYNDERGRINFLHEKSNIIITKYGMNLRCLEKFLIRIKKELLKSKQIEKFIKIDKFIKNSQIDVCVRPYSIEENTPIKSEPKNAFLEMFSVFKPAPKKKDIEEDDNNGCSIIIKRFSECTHKKLLFLEKITEGKPDTKKTKSGKVKSEVTNKIESHVYSIEEFIKKFIKFGEIKEDIINGDQKHKIFEAIGAYMEIIKEHISKEELFSIYSQDDINDILEDVENYILRKCYKSFYPSMESQEDKEFYNKCLSLSWLTPNHIEIKKILVKEKLWLIASNCLTKMDTEKTPIEKLRCVQSAYQILNNSISFSSNKQTNAGVDDIMPILIYVMIKTKPRRMITNLNYIKTLMHPKRLLGQFGFLQTQIKSVVEYIINLTYSNLKMSKEEFSKLSDDTLKLERNKSQTWIPIQKK